MIAYIKGKLINKNPVSVTIETSSGLAFDLKIPVSTFEQLPGVGNPCQLYTHLHIAQDDIRLFGFHTPAERELFLILTSVSGIGPKIALSILSTMQISTFVRAIENGEEGLITRVPGLGKKSAQRLILELRGGFAALGDHFKAEDQILQGSVVDEVESALVTLGFNPKDIRRELALLPDDAKTMSSEQLIKETIKRLYQRTR